MRSVLEAPSVLTDNARCDSGGGSRKRILLYSLVGSVVLGAAFGVFTVLRGQWSWFEIRVVLSTIVIALASLCGLACDLSRASQLSRAKRVLNLLPKAGLMLTVAAAAAMLVGMWAKIEVEFFWKLSFSAAVLAVATVHVCMLSFARLAKRFGWVYAVAFQLIYGLALVLIYAIMAEGWSESIARIIAVLCILATALTLIIPLLHRISRTNALPLDVEAPLSPFEQGSLAEIELELSRLHRRVAELEVLKQRLANPSLGN